MTNSQPPTRINPYEWWLMPFAVLSAVLFFLLLTKEHHLQNLATAGLAALDCVAIFVILRKRQLINTVFSALWIIPAFLCAAWSIQHYSSADPWLTGSAQWLQLTASLIGVSFGATYIFMESKRIGVRHVLTDAINVGIATAVFLLLWMQASTAQILEPIDQTLMLAGAQLFAFCLSLSIAITLSLIDRWRSKALMTLAVAVALFTLHTLINLLAVIFETVAAAVNSQTMTRLILALGGLTIVYFTTIVKRCEIAERPESDNPQAYISGASLMSAVPMAIVFSHLTAGVLPNTEFLLTALVLVNALAFFRYRESLILIAQSKKLLTSLAYRDDLTGVLNRRGMTQHLCKNLNRGDRLVLIDINDFQSINTSHGQRIGDAFLCSISKQLSNLDCVLLTSRWGSDEFLVQLKTDADFDQIMELIQFELQSWRELYNTRVYANVSIGGLTVEDPTELNELFVALDSTVYRAKRESNGRYRHQVSFGSEINRQYWRELVQNTLDSGSLCLRYQPIVDLSTRRCVAAEVLLRLEHQDGTLISPAEFLPKLRDPAQLVQLTLAMPKKISEHLAAMKGLTLHINLPPAMVIDRQFRDELHRAFVDAGIKPSKMTLEVTEDEPADLDELADALASLRVKGYHAAIDDYGTAHSSLARIAAVEIDELKIDKSMLAEATRGRKVFIETSVIMAKRLGLLVTCEGIETEEEYLLARSLGIEQGQGYYFGQPMTVQALIAQYDMPDDSIIGVQEDALSFMQEVLFKSPNDGY